MTEHTTTASALPLGSDGYAWWSVAGAAAGSRLAFAPLMANGNPTGTDAGKGNAASAYVPSVSIAA